jgi:hypothetical protein
MNIMNEINFENIKGHTDLLETLRVSMGYILPDILDEMLEAFGDDFNVVLKLYTGNRKFISLNDLNNLRETDVDLYDDIREVFIASDDYNYLFKNI